MGVWSPSILSKPKNFTKVFNVTLDSYLLTDYIVCTLLLMNHTTELIISLLAKGVSAVQVANTAGVTEAYVSQLQKNPEIAAQIQAAGVEKLAMDVAFDTSLEKAEQLALNKIEAYMPHANFGQAIAAFKLLNMARKRSDPRIDPPSTTATIHVNLTLPAAAASRYIVNSANEVVEVEGTPMITATAKSLDNLLAQRAVTKLHQPEAVTLNRAANMLQQISDRQLSNTPRARRLPASLSADVL